MPNVSGWSSFKDMWAPDVKKINGKYILYYSARRASDNVHCVGAATSDTVLGPYKPEPEPLACHADQGGSIDPSGFTDSDGQHYMTYKIDGNSKGHGPGPCGNSEEPIHSTPLMLMQFEADGYTRTSHHITEILDRGKYDGPLIEAPYIIKYDGVYFLFFSSNCYSSDVYDTSYATASSVWGPYTKATKPLMVTNNPFALTSPGGASVTTDGKAIVFHARCDVGRCMYERSLKISGKIVTFA